MKVDETRDVFENIRRRLARSRGRYEGHREVQHLYVFEGEGDEIREFWEKMMKVRMEFFEKAGPCGTGVRYRVLPTAIC
jgi:2-iminobutanoate/2-iminopropanoate deaminase